MSLKEQLKNSISIPVGAVLLLLSCAIFVHSQLAEDLYLAAGAGDINQVRKLLNEGVNPNAAVDSSGVTALMQAARIGDTEMVKLLLRKGAQVNAKAGAMGITALIHASITGDMEMVKALIDKGADVNTSDTGGLTALSHAKVAKKADIAEYLKARGAKEKSERMSSSLLRGRYSLTSPVSLP